MAIVYILLIYIYIYTNTMFSVHVRRIPLVKVCVEREIKNHTVINWHSVNIGMCIICSHVTIRYWRFSFSRGEIVLNEH
jgi:hypothetical protein